MENSGWNILLKLFNNCPFRFLISGIVAAVVYFITPNNSNILKKFNVAWYIIFVGLITFMLLTFVLWIIDTVKKKKNLVVEANKTFEELKQDLFNITDMLDETELNIIKTIVKNGNEPYLATAAEKHCFNNRLFSIGFPKYKEVNYRINGNYLSECDFMYWLDDTLYRLAKTVYENCGKISRFDKKDDRT